MAFLKSRSAQGESRSARRGAPALDPSLVARVRSHHRSFGQTHVLKDVDLDIAPGEFVALLGRSGCGKSTLLRSLAGLDPAPVDEVQVSGRTSVAFQEPRLLPWRDVRENVALALLNAPERAERHRLADERITEVGLSGKSDAWPLQLSGGQAQRVSLARALVSNPSLLLLDEPFSALDALTRIEMHQLVIDLWRRHSMAILIVTHDVDEALALADRLIVLDEGKVADSWQITLPRSDRDHSQPEIARTRSAVLQALGVRPTPPNPNRQTQKQGAA
ncbi:ABC transporter ATP-binding protein [Nocardioides sp. P86]|uniref:ABC transporter ATP-binding protein n=1 Tax=Nocardioides sp. P86 TaxID=2939569 RepID=UPI00203C13C4|nr:ABC transporter ATP-binding protein [Nocardioides sp. P86]MCM3513645.1 ABC transporter ATP-binding protein [Nocardioides sp. P86]